MRSRWLWVVFVALLALVVADALADGRWVFAPVYAVVALAIGWWTSPWRGRGGTRHREVLEMTQDDPRKDVVVYWRPGCGYCARLRSSLGSHGDEATWVNIWDDEEAAAFVRSVNDGNETVPTVVIDGVPHTNPRPSTVLERLTAS